jgi:hypothetical protein
MEGIECTQLGEEDILELSKPFSVEEIKEVIDVMKHNKAAGPDGFPAEFNQIFWEVIKHDLKEMLDKFHTGQLDFERLNHGVISLIPKAPNAIVVHKFRSICLLNVSYKILTKILANGLGFIIYKVISDTHNAFIKARFIMEGIVILHETIHEHHKKLTRVLFKIDFEKAFDKVNWAFLYQMMQAKGFGDILCDWVMKVVKGGRVAIKVNDVVGLTSLLLQE